MVPFGLNIAPRVFTKLVNIIITTLRQQGINVIAYLDDWLVWGKSSEECALAVIKTRQELERRGFLLNLLKLRLTPLQEFQWLGLKWDTRKYTLSLAAACQFKTIASVTLFLRRSEVSRRDLERILGTLQFCSTVDSWLKVMLKDAAKFWKFAATKTRRDVRRPLQQDLINLLSAWTGQNSLDLSVLLLPLR